MATLKEINGKSINPNVRNIFTYDEVKQLSIEDIKSLIWKLTCNMTNPSQFIYGKDHNRNESEEIWNMAIEASGEIIHSYEEVKAIESIEDAADFYTKTLNALQEITDMYESMLWNAQADEGENMYRVLQSNRITGEFNLSPAQLYGYVKAIGGWNEFYPEKVRKAIFLSEEILPRVQWPNNPNRGMTKRQWSIKDDYIFINSDYITGDDLEAWKNIAPQLETIWREAGADSFRYEIQKAVIGTDEHECGITYIMWWD